MVATRYMRTAWLALVLHSSMAVTRASTLVCVNDHARLSVPSRTWTSVMSEMEETVLRASST